MSREGRKNFLVPETQPYTCEHCGTSVIGGRYNNHCPNCLWSKHVDDIIPGDRSSDCRSLMEPVGVTQKKGVWRITHQCLGCDHTFTGDSAPDDNFDVIIALSLKVTNK